ncbi:hypothetical protein GCM10012278_07110 [Nonomuraea glycinis]|uniref:TIR domain-containing protein n=2 Tax=Nonomuraea glycinis TaxID=2047744 RepID=A0A917ZZG6_9ACTN|nr:hypothetical protein GCM10012278_07110 [Nonomuraea glycinis]
MVQNGKYDAFVSYSHHDRDWVKQFVGRLQGLDLKVAWDGEFIQVGDLLVIDIEEAIRNSANGILIFSPASVASKWVKNEYAVMMQRAIENDRRFIPVIIEDAEIPLFAHARYAADFRDTNSARWDEVLQQIVRAVRHGDEP